MFCYLQHNFCSEMRVSNRQILPICVFFPFRGFLAVPIASRRLGIRESTELLFSIPPVRISCLNFSALDSSFRRKSDSSRLDCSRMDALNLNFLLPNKVTNES